MTISSTTRKAGPFFGNDATIDFPFTFKVFKKQDVRVTLTNPIGEDYPLVLDSSYSATLNVNQDANPGGNIRYPVSGLPLPVGWRLTVTGGLPNTQPTDIQNNGGFYPQVVEDMGDRSTIQIQQLQEQVDRSLKFSISDPGTGAVLPPADLRANKVLGFDEDGRPTALIPSSGTAADVLLQLLSSAGASLIGFLQAGVAAIRRTVQDKLRDTISVRDFIAGPIDGVTSNQAGIEAAVAAAFSTGADLKWPAGPPYVSTSNIPNFHLVRHIGPGLIKRGSILFRPAPKGNEANVLYIKSPAGAIVGDGISPDFPLTNLQAALDALMFRGYVDGAWSVQVPAGTYLGADATAHLGHRNESLPPTGAYFRDGVAFRNALLIKGADVGYHPVSNPEPVPTTIFNGAGNPNGLHLEDTDMVVIRDIKFLNYTSSGGSGVLADKTDIRTENVHTENCWFGISGVNYVRLEIKGGVIYGNTDTGLTRTGIRALFQCKLEIGNQLAGGRGQGPRIEANRIGLLAQEGTTGHTDYVTFANNGVGLRIASRSRVNCTGSSFARHLQAIRADTNSDVFYNTGSVEFFTGTADANTENVVVQTGAVLSGDEIDTYANMGLATDYLNTPYVLTGTTASTPILLKTLKRGYFSPVPTSARKPILIEVVGHGTFTGTGGTKQIKMRMGSSLIGSTTTDPSITGPFQFHWVGMLRSPTSQSGSIAVLTHLNPTRVNAASLSIDMNAADVPLQFEAQLGSAGDTITIESCVFKTWG